MPAVEASISLSKEARRCGGVIAALLTNLRKTPSGAKVAITDFEGMESLLIEALDRLQQLGIAEVVETSEGRVVVKKV
ncbi:MAG: hypothetical protein F7B20_05435 [Aeropyrum sp.]|nr:hypothetical protein [Aeropyrum sp.]